jgi:hypothetical protein
MVSDIEKDAQQVVVIWEKVPKTAEFYALCIVKRFEVKSLIVSKSKSLCSLSNKCLVVPLPLQPSKPLVNQVNQNYGANSPS